MGLAIKGLLAASQGILAASQAILAARGEWALNEKRLIERAGMGDVAATVLSQEKDLAAALLDARSAVVTRAAAADEGARGPGGRISGR